VVSPQTGGEGVHTVRGQRGAGGGGRRVKCIIRVILKILVFWGDNPFGGVSGAAARDERGVRRVAPTRPPPGRAARYVLAWGDTTPCKVTPVILHGVVCGPVSP